MKGIKILCAIYFLSANSFAQERIDARAIESITIAELRDHLYYLASDELQGRETGTSGYDKAAEYVASQFRGAGLTPLIKTNDSTLSYYQPFTYEKYSPNPNNSIIIKQADSERKFLFEDNFILAFIMGPVDVTSITGKLAFAGAGIREPEYGVDDYKNIDAKGKWVIITAPPEDLPLAIRKKLPDTILKKYENNLPFKRSTIIQNARDAGAIGIICISSKSWFPNMKKNKILYRDMVALPLNDHQGNDSLNFPFCFTRLLPLIYIDSAMTGYLFNKENYDPDILNKESYRTFEFKNSELTFNKAYNFSATIKTANVVGLIEGSDPVLKNEYITVSAHLDALGIHSGSVMNGADDDASGSAGVLEIGEALAKSKLKRSVICVTFSGEEKGLLGSAHFVENPPVPLQNIKANINLDMVGFPNPLTNGITPVCDESIPSTLKEIIVNVSKERKYVQLDWENAIQVRKYASDNNSFLKKNIPAVLFFACIHPEYHTPMDDAKTIDFDFLQKNCKFIYEVSFELANSF